MFATWLVEQDSRCCSPRQSVHELVFLHQAKRRARSKHVQLVREAIDLRALGGSNIGPVSEQRRWNGSPPVQSWNVVLVGGSRSWRERSWQSWIDREIRRSCWRSVVRHLTAGNDRPWRRSHLCRNLVQSLRNHRRDRRNYRSCGRNHRRRREGSTTGFSLRGLLRLWYSPCRPVCRRSSTAKKLVHAWPPRQRP